MKLSRFSTVLASITLAGCASGQDRPASMSAYLSGAVPLWLGGEPSDVPPRRGTAEYDAWMAERAKEAARPKTDQHK